MGALTSKPFAYSNRAWENSVRIFTDFFDPMAQKIAVYLRKNQPTRVSGVGKQLSYDFWVTDKIRFAISTINFNRVLSINFLISKKKNRLLYILLTTERLLRHFFDNWYTKGSTNVDVVIGKFLDIVQGRNLANFALKSLGLSIVQPASKSFYVASTQVTRDNMYICMENVAYCMGFLCVGLNIRKISPSFFIYLQQNLKTNLGFLGVLLSNFFVNVHSLYTIKITHFSNHLKNLFSYCSGSHLLLNETLLSFKLVTVLFSDQIARFMLCLNSKTYLDTFYNVLGLDNIGKITQLEMSLFSGFDVFDRNYNKYVFLKNPLTEKKNKNKNVLYLLDANATIFDQSYYDLVVYRGVYWEGVAWLADIVLPTVTLLETPTYALFAANGEFNVYRQPITLQAQLMNVPLFLSSSEPMAFCPGVYDNIIMSHDSFFYALENTQTSYYLRQLIKMTGCFLEDYRRDYFWDVGLAKVNPIFSLKTKMLQFVEANLLSFKD